MKDSDTTPTILNPIYFYDLVVGFVSIVRDVQSTEKANEQKIKQNKKF